MATTKHAARQTFVAICLLATLLSAARMAHAEDEPPATPPKWMPALTAEAIQRLSPMINNLSVYPRACAAVTELLDGKEGEPDRVDQICKSIRERLAALAGEDLQVLKPFQIVCSLDASVHTGMLEVDKFDYEDATSVYIFKNGDVDPARVLWDKLRADPATEVKRMREVDVLRRAVARKKGSQNFYYWSPRKGVAVVVQGEKLIDDTVRDWSAAQPGHGPYPWELPEWKHIGPDSLGWGFMGKGVERSAHCIDSKLKEPRTAPPRWIRTATADAIRRLSPRVDTVLVSEGARPALIEPPESNALNKWPGLEEIARTLADTLDKTLRLDTHRQLNLLLDEDRSVLKPFQIQCALQALSEYKSVDHKQENHYDATAVYLFKVERVDPARVVWNTLRSDPSVTVKRIGGVEVLCRSFPGKKETENFYYWSPKPGIGVVVRREKLLEDTVRRWSIPDPRPDPFPWSLPEWDSISPNASTWGIGRSLGWVPLPIGRAVLSIDPKDDPTTVRITGYERRDDGKQNDEEISRTLLCIQLDPKDEQTAGGQSYLLGVLIDLLYLPNVTGPFGP